MRLHRLGARIKTLAGALAAFAGLALIVHFAIADGIEGARRHHRQRTPAPHQSTAAAPEVPALLGGQSTTLAPAPMPASAPASDCISREEAYRIISATTEGESIEAINAALAELNANPASTSTPSPLAARLRTALNLAGGHGPCDTTQQALNDALQLAQVASTAGPDTQTAGVGEPSPLSPVSYTYVPPGTPNGDGGWGYRVGHE